MNRARQFIEYIDENVNQNTSMLQVLGASVSFYSFGLDIHGLGEGDWCDGEIVRLRGGSSKPMKFYNFGAEVDINWLQNVFDYTWSLSTMNNDILSPYLLVYCQTNPLPLPHGHIVNCYENCSMNPFYNNPYMNGFWSIGYEWFDATVHQWGLSRYQLNPYPPLPDFLVHGESRLHDSWIVQIRGLLSTIGEIHENGYYHGSLQCSSMYVMVQGRIKLFNVANSLDGVRDRQDMKMRDYSSFGDFINSLLYGYHAWNNKDNFLLFFQLTGRNDFVQKLMDHPFLLTPSLRMDRIDYVYQSMTPLDHAVFMNSHLAFAQFFDWNSDRRAWLPFMIKVYKYKGLTTKYGREPDQLFRFMRNTKHHFDRYRVAIVDVDVALRGFWPDFFDSIHATYP